MKNATLDPKHDTTSAKDAFAYWLIHKLGNVQAFLYEHVIEQPVWRSFDGSVHVPRSMTDRHLFNTVSLIEREGETNKPIYRALRAEYDRRQTEKMVQLAMRIDEQRVIDSENLARRKIALDNTPPFMALPSAWVSVSTPNPEQTRVYKHDSGAKVFLSSEGYWLWFKANRHHIQCRDKKDSLWAAMEAALQD